MWLCREVLAWKLVDCPELGYTTADKPHPRGELRLKTRRMIPGYFKRPEVSRAARQVTTTWHTLSCMYPSSKGLAVFPGCETGSALEARFGWCSCERVFHLSRFGAPQSRADLCNGEGFPFLSKGQCHSCVVLAQSLADLYDGEGFLMTGDVMEQTGPDTLVWIDRVKNIIKLAQVRPRERECMIE